MDENRQPGADTKDGKAVIRFASHLSELARLADWLGVLAEHYGFEHDDHFRINLVLEEALTNIITYGFEEDHAHTIQVTFSREPGRAVFEIRDDGKLFDPSAYPAVDVAQKFVEGKVGGLGIHLIRNYVDSFDYHRKADKNHLRLFFSIG